ncbi:hypothetical protein [Paracoccus sp. pheM1]|uniref:hypothetical protein n=1 Tax=Paracoccus sp. pheM1 TaxID=2831675 RepID=UPI001BDB8CA8|nr:hypothetical protein [Paracoccus sp. pheM1]MBT0779442.1 hypothetical protein [Paracoccus sp. pheM1]
MQYQIERIEREFSAGEIAEFIGVSQVMQRDWRRHGYLPPSEPRRRVKFGLLQMAYLGLMKVQIDAGKPPSTASGLAKWTAPLAVMQIEICPPAVKIEGIDLPDSEKRRFMYEMANRTEDEAGSRYLFFPNRQSLPKTSLPGGEDTSPVGCYSFGSLAEMEGAVERDWITGQIFDLEAFAMSLALKAGPLITYRASPEAP